MAHRRLPLMRTLQLNTAVLVVEIAAGIGSNSFSLIMDGVHNLSDEVVLVFLVLAYSLRVGLSGRLLRSANLFNSGILIFASGRFLFDSLFALLIAIVVATTTLRAIIGSHEELLWPENVSCGHPTREPTL